MKVVIELDDASLLEIFGQAKKMSIPVEELIRTKLTLSDEQKEEQLEELDDEEIDTKVIEMLIHARDTYDHDDEPFMVQELFAAKYGKGVWKILSNSTRKKIGRRFKVACDESALSGKGAGSDVYLYGKTTANAALYKIHPPTFVRKAPAGEAQRLKDELIGLVHRGESGKNS